MRAAALIILAIASSSGAAADEAAFTKAKASIIKKLKDPDSARFQDLRMAGIDWVCGSVNAKNQFGGYAGAKPFYYDVRGDMGFVPQGTDVTTDPLDSMAMGYGKYCGR
jgi:hypothetical protein